MRKRRWPRWLLVLAGLLALWLGSLAWVQTDLRRQAAYSTGDALLDRYLALALPGSALTADSAAQLKSEFGTDPRMWELLLMVSESGSTLSEHFPQYWSQPVAELIEEARAHDALSAPLLSEQIRALEQAWDAEAPQHQTPSQTGRPTTPQERDKRLQERIALKISRWKLIHETHGPQRARLYDELVGLDPDNSAGYYRRAQMHASVGDYKRAMADVVLGNAAPRNDPLLLFPLVERSRMLREGKDYRTQQAVDIVSMGLTSKFVSYRDFMTGLWNHALNSDDPELRQSVHTLFCNEALRTDVEVLDLLIANIIFTNQARTAAAGLEAGSAESIAISRYSGGIQSLSTEVKRIQTHSPRRDALDRRGPLSWFTDRLGLPSWSAYARAIMADEAEQLQMIDTSVRPIIERLAEFDWRTLAWPDEDADSLPLPEPAAD